MANAISSTVAPAAALESIKSLSDAAYQQAKAGRTIRDMAAYVMEREPGFLTEGVDGLTDEGKAALTEGYRMAFNEIRDAVTYYKVGETYVKESDFTGDKAKATKVKVTVQYALSFSTHEFGKMADTHGAQFKGIIGAVREATSTYVSNRFGDLKRAAKEIDAEKNGKSRTRKAPPAFTDRVADALKDLQAKCTTSNQRGDTTADKAKLAKAIGAFNAVWKA